MDKNQKKRVINILTKEKERYEALIEDAVNIKLETAREEMIKWYKWNIEKLQKIEQDLEEI